VQALEHAAAKHRYYSRRAVHASFESPFASQAAGLWNSCSLLD
jgi:hypothetical protein